MSSGLECTVCQESDLVEIGELDCCDHVYCVRCILEWAKITNRCPLCKQRFWTVKHKQLDLERLPKEDADEVAVKFPGEVLQEHAIPERDQRAGVDAEFVDPWETLVCMECGGVQDEDLLMLCDGCNQGCHTYCAVPSLDAVPDGDWFCSACAPTLAPTLAHSHPTRQATPASRGARTGATQQASRRGQANARSVRRQRRNEARAAALEEEAVDAESSDDGFEGRRARQIEDAALLIGRAIGAPVTRSQGRSPRSRRRSSQAAGAASELRMTHPSRAVRTAGGVRRTRQLIRHVAAASIGSGAPNSLAPTLDEEAPSTSHRNINSLRANWDAIRFGTRDFARPSEDSDSEEDDPSENVPLAARVAHQRARRALEQQQAKLRLKEERRQERLLKETRLREATAGGGANPASISSRFRAELAVATERRRLVSGNGGEVGRRPGGSLVGCEEHAASPAKRRKLEDPKPRKPSRFVVEDSTDEDDQPLIRLLDKRASKKRQREGEPPRQLAAAGEDAVSPAEQPNPSSRVFPSQLELPLTNRPRQKRGRADDPQAKTSAAEGSDSIKKRAQTAQSPKRRKPSTPEEESKNGLARGLQQILERGLTPQDSAMAQKRLENIQPHPAPPQSDHKGPKLAELRHNDEEDVRAMRPSIPDGDLVSDEAAAVASLGQLKPERPETGRRETDNLGAIPARVPESTKKRKRKRSEKRETSQGNAALPSPAPPPAEEPALNKEGRQSLAARCCEERPAVEREGQRLADFSCDANKLPLQPPANAEIPDGELAEKDAKASALKARKHAAGRSVKERLEPWYKGGEIDSEVFKRVAKIATREVYKTCSAEIGSKAWRKATAVAVKTAMKQEKVGAYAIR